MFFSPFCVRQLLRFNLLTWPKDVEVFVTNCMNNIHGRVLQEWTRCVFFTIVFIFVPTMFSGILGSFGKNSTVLSPFLVCIQNIDEEYVLSPEFSMFSASACVAPFFSNTCLQGWVFFSCTWEHESRVFEPVLRCCATRA